jgi:ribosome-binding protein aMBF1 (putative translation factor)
MKKAAAKTATTTRVPKKRGRPPATPPTPIAAAIRAARLKRGLTLEQAAAKIDAPYQTWQKWENGRNEPTIESLRKIADALGVPLAALIG